jgi:hypothetical protein
MARKSFNGSLLQNAFTSVGVISHTAGGYGELHRRLPSFTTAHTEQHSDRCQDVLLFPFHQVARQLLQRHSPLTEAFQFGKGVVYQGVGLPNRSVNAKQGRVRGFL